MSRATPAKRNKYQADTRPRVRGVVVLRILCGLLLVLNLWLLYGIFSSSQGVLNYRRHRQQVEELESKIRNVQVENHKLFKQIEDFKSLPKVQERLVRKHLGWAREDELVIEFLPSEEDSSR
jgi:cell division protein FtsB